ncbi:MAG: AAA-like domain-containing protein [Candidatus Magnetomorum sp.]|nr:AAA-like domain-containing protein [Candidatus Magnetomorum sp.]
MKFFNTSGPCEPEDHYMVNCAERLTSLYSLIENKRYFIFHGPRQTGKTTNMIAFTRELNAQEQYLALYVNVEAGQACRNDVEAVNEIIVSEFEHAAMTFLSEQYLPSENCYQFRSLNTGLGTFLTKWCMELPKPLVLFLDEVDALIGDSLISVLRQLRSGYARRPKAFPHAMGLIGVRDIRDYRIYSDSSKKYIIGGSAFNIKEKSLRLNNFTLTQINDLYTQHTDVTGQAFTRQAIARVFDLTDGQPWLVNALAREICFEDRIAQGLAVTVDHVDRAKEVLIERRDVHLDQLADKLSEPRVMRVIQNILLGEYQENNILPDDIQYLIDLGLIKKGSVGLEIANSIYREVIPRELTVVTQMSINQNPAWYTHENGKLNINKLLDEYILFYKQHSEMITARKTYTEAAHHLFFMAWLQRIVNSGGMIDREYAAGLKRLDLCVNFAGERFAFELKLSSQSALDDGKKQLVNYLNRLELNCGYLIIFNRKKIDDWNVVGKKDVIEYEGKQITVIYL